MKNDIKSVVGALTVIGTIVAGYCFIEDRVEAKTEKVKTEVKENVDELKKDSQKKDEKQDEKIETLEEYSIRQSVILERAIKNLDKLEGKLEKDNGND